MTLRWRLRTILVGIAAIAGSLALIVMDLRRSREIQGPDVVGVKVPSADTDRPITGHRLVRPDGTISLGHYGIVDVAGLTPRETRSRIAAPLRHHPAAGGRFADHDAGAVSVQVFKKNTARGFYAKAIRDVFRSADFGPG